MFEVSCPKIVPLANATESFAKGGVSAVGLNVVPKVGLVTSVSSKLIKFGARRFNAGLMIVSISRFVTCAVSEMIERVVLICPSTSSSY